MMTNLPGADLHSRRLPAKRVKCRDALHESGMEHHTANWSIADRSRQFALRIIRLYSALPKSTEAQVIGKQLLRSGTSVGAHVREGKRSRSNAEMISKLEVALQELDESLYWLELLVESELIDFNRIRRLMEEANALISILVASVKILKKRNS